jgi:hypothetical protein
MPMNSCEFGENRCSERHTFLTGVKEILPLIFCVYIRRNGERPGYTELDYFKYPTFCVHSFTYCFTSLCIICEINLKHVTASNSSSSTINDWILFSVPIYIFCSNSTQQHTVTNSGLIIIIIIIQYIFQGRNNITYSTYEKYRTAATVLTLETGFVSGM